MNKCIALMLTFVYMWLSLASVVAQVSGIALIELKNWPAHLHFLILLPLKSLEKKFLSTFVSLNEPI